jgi:5-carboxymethyl-2-hydroxymuconate isomerase
MPHLVLEYSNDLVEPIDHPALLAALHAALDRLGIFKPEDIKSRVVAHERYRIGAGEPGQLFFHLTVSIMKGRDLAIRKQIGAELLEVLRRGVGQNWEARRSDLTVEVREMERESYAKVVSR